MENRRMPRDFRSWRPMLHRPRRDAPTLLAAGLVAVWLVVKVLGGPEACWAWYETLGLSRAGVAAGRIWQVITHMMLHGTALHLFANAALVFGIGGRVARFVGDRAFLRIVFAGTVTGTGFHLALPPLWEPEPVLVGASGGAMALLIAFTTLSPDSRMWLLPVSARNLGRGVLIGAGILAGVQAAFSLGLWIELRETAIRSGWSDLFRIGHGYHLGGGFAGWLAARWVLRRPVDLATLQRRRRAREAAGD